MSPRKPETGLLHLSDDGIRRFRIQLVVLVIVYTIAVYSGLYVQSKRLLDESLRAQGVSYFDLVYHTRSWNARLGGAWVNKANGAETNKWLADLGVQADTVTVDGLELTLRNPSAMTREISELTLEDSGVSFHITDGDAMNPDNLPDEWEAESLEAFANGTKWTETFDRSGEVDVYRYMQPLFVDGTCTGCHADGGFEPGTTEGGVSITIPTAEVDEQLRRTQVILVTLAIVTLVIALSSSQWALARLWRRILDTNEQLELMAVTDELTGLENRRATLQRLATEHARAQRTGSPISLIEFDIDHFKSINDTLGHAAGDVVLREIGARMADSIRQYDTLGRIGGEEFLVVSPNTDARDAALLAERVIDRVRSEPFETRESIPLIVTMSAGVATMHADDMDTDTLLARADAALYAAKESGRDQVASAESSS